MKPVLFFVVFFLIKASANDISREVNILWEKYGDVRADIETLKAEVRSYTDTETQLKEFKEDIEELKSEMDMLKNSLAAGRSSQDDQVTTPGECYTPIQFELQGASVTTSNSGRSVTFTADYSASANIPVAWAVDYVQIYDMNTDYVINTFPHQNHYRSTMTARIPPEEMKNRNVYVYFGNIQSVHPVERTEFVVYFNTTDLSEKSFDEVIGLSYKIETGRSERSLQKTFTFVPKFGDFGYEADRFYSSYLYLNDTDSEAEPGYAMSFLGGRPEGGISTQNTTNKKEKFKVVVALNNSLERFGGDLYANVYYSVRDSVIEQLELRLNLNDVFTDGKPIESLQGKFSLYQPLTREMSTGHTGLIRCFGFGYPAPLLQIVKLSADNTTSSVSFHPVWTYQSNHYSLTTVAILNLTKEMEGNYACIGMVGGVTKRRVFPVEVSITARFNHSTTKVTKYPNGEVTVNVSASGDPVPRITCWENSKQGEQVESGAIYEVMRFENSTQNTGYLNIEFNTENNGSSYGPLYRFVCSSNQFLSHDDDWLTVIL